MGRGKCRRVQDAAGSCAEGRSMAGTRQWLAACPVLPLPLMECEEEKNVSDLLMIYFWTLFGGGGKSLCDLGNFGFFFLLILFLDVARFVH